MRVSIAWKVNLLVLLNVALLLGTSLGVGLTQISALQESTVESALVQSTGTTLLLFSPADVAGVTLDGLEKSEYQKKLAGIRQIQTLFGLSDVYVLRPTPDGEWEFVWDAKDAPYDEENGVPVKLSVYQDPPDELGQSAETQKTVVTPLPYTDEFGTFRSAFAPLVDADGTVRALVGADFNLVQLEDARRAEVFFLGVLLVVGLFFLVIVFWLLNRILVRPLGQVSHAFDNLASGHVDLSQRLVLRNRDEMGSLAQSANVFLEKWQNLTGDLLASSGEIGAIQQGIHRSSLQIAESTSALRGGVESIKQSLTRLDKALAETENEGALISGNATQLVDWANAQARSADSAAGNQQALDGTLQVWKQSNRVARNTLQGIADGTRENAMRLETNQKRLDRLSGRVSSLEEIVVTLKDTSSRTNLLAMNASIEAAHAGIHGKGFQVLAHEIRRLAENSRQESDRVAAGLAEMIEDIHEATREGNQTASGFRDTLGLLSETGHALETLEEVDQALGERSQSISRSLEELRAASRDVLAASQAVAGSQERASGEVHNLHRVSSEVLDELAQWTESDARNASVVEALGSLAESLTRVSQALEENLKLFKVEP